MSLQAKVVSVTPEMAAEMLTRNTGNFRPMDKYRVRKYAADMAASKWHLNGETIKVSADGTILDGQHRLSAIVLSGVTVRILIVSGVESSAAAIDRGRPRTVGQWLRHENIKNANTVASAAKLVLAHDRGLWSKSSFQVDEIRDTEIIEFALANNHRLQEVMDACKHQTKIVPLTHLTAVGYVGTRNVGVDHPMATWFFEALRNGTDLGEHDPVLHLRNRAANQTASSKLTKWSKRMLLTMAWNKTALGEPCTKSGMRIVTTGPGKSSVPNSIVELTE